jgi:ornithine cyclodeaminase/alanine dehydrogenase-like protein (mu-crystallin family)
MNRAPGVDRPRERAPQQPPLRYLAPAELEACLPPVSQRIGLVRQALLALAHDDAEMPAKIGVHPRPGALLHAMPAWLRSSDLVGLKWVAAFPANRARGLPAISGVVVLNDADTGQPTWIMDAARITALRTAAVSGMAIELLAPAGAAKVAVLGAGVQARSHIELVAELLPDAAVALFDRNPGRAAAVATEVNGALGRELVSAAESVPLAVADAGVVITVATLGAQAERLVPAAVAAGARVVAVDFATYVAPELARAARVFAVDDRAQFVAYRELGYFDGYPDPTTTLGELAAASGGAVGDRRADEPVLATHLGVGLADVVFADAIARAAENAGMGSELPR